jgi:acyl-CoA synthetase (AMP-forming)/AMP-acid ligase II
LFSQDAVPNADFDEGKMSTLQNPDIGLQSNLAECFGEELHDLNQTLWDMFSSTAEQHPDRDAVSSIWQPQEHLRNLTGNQAVSGSVDVMRWTYTDLLAATELVAIWLESRGCTAGQRLVVFLWNSTEWALFFWVAARLRMTYIPLDPRNMEKSADEYLELLHPSVLVVQDEAAAINFEKACSRLKDVKIRISCTESASEYWTSLCDLSSPLDSTVVQELTHQHRPAKANSPGQDLALIVFTSGTTSIPKGCCHTAVNLWSQSHDFDPETEPNLFDKWLVHTPVSHIFAINNALRAWRYGGSVIFASKSFDITMSLKALKGHRCTRMSAVPTLVQALLSHPEWDNEKESLALRYVSLGGTLIKGEDIKMCKRLGSDAVIQAYGMSEGAPISSDKRVDPRLLSTDYPGVGKVLPGARLRICELGSQTTLNRNVPGELHIGGTSVITGYLNDANPESFYTDEYGGWLRTGDQALIDENGVLQILGRYKDLIIRGGENISPAKIESHMGQIPGLLVSINYLRNSCLWPIKCYSGSEKSKSNFQNENKVDI